MRSFILCLWVVLATTVGRCDGRLAAQTARKPLPVRHPPSLESAAQRLAKLAGTRIRSYSTYDFGRSRDRRARSVVVPAARANSVLGVVRAGLPPGLIAFVGTTRWLGDEKHAGYEVVLAPGKSQWDILRIARSDAINYDMETEDLVRKLAKWDREFGIDLFHAETDTIEFRFRRKPKDIPAFCREAYKLCPDIVDQGVGTVGKLEASVRESDRFLLWWD